MAAGPAGIARDLGASLPSRPNLAGPLTGALGHAVLTHAGRATARASGFRAIDHGPNDEVPRDPQQAGIEPGAGRDSINHVLAPLAPVGVLYDTGGTGEHVRGVFELERDIKLLTGGYRNVNGKLLGLIQVSKLVHATWGHHRPLESLWPLGLRRKGY